VRSPRAPLDPLMTPDEVAGILRVSRKTVLALVRRGELHGVRIGNRIRMRADEVAAWLEARGGGQ
jgi:excisionase family DNA binding protein